MAIFDLSHKPTGWRKHLFKAPTHLYRARLGFLFAHRFVMIEHRGRRSNTVYRTVVEVAGHRRDEWICASGTGSGADWYRNQAAGGLEALWLGSRRHRATLRFLEPTEAADVMAGYQRAHPKTTEKLFESMGISYDGTDAGWVEMMAKVTMVAFTMRGGD